MQQAARVSDSTAFFYMGEMVEFGDTKKIFTNPDKVETQNYITGTLRVTDCSVLWQARYHAVVQAVSRLVRAVPRFGTGSFMLGTDGTALWYEQCHALKQVI